MNFLLAFNIWLLHFSPIVYIKYGFKCFASLCCRLEVYLLCFNDKTLLSNYTTSQGYITLKNVDQIYLQAILTIVKLAFESQISGDSQIRIQCFESATCSYKYLVGNGSRKSNFNTKLKLNITYRQALSHRYINPSILFNCVKLDCRLETRR